MKQKNILGHYPNVSFLISDLNVMYLLLHNFTVDSHFRKSFKVNNGIFIRRPYSDNAFYHVQKYEGYPSGSMVDFACDADGSPILAVSDLAVHTKVHFIISGG